MAISSFMVPLGTPAPEFDLPSVDGPRVALSDLTGPALLVAFLCNHCPYVKHIEHGFAEAASEFMDSGVDVVGIVSNDTDTYPDDDIDGLRDQVERAGFAFPYLIDTSQHVALAFRAACTPDFFLYDGDRKLAYRGAFDESRPRSEAPVTGELLRAAVKHVLRGEAVPQPHTPSLGCGIKWKPENADALQQ